jgi:site-specific DNA-methyltransferase (adenine-specific)
LIGTLELNRIYCGDCLDLIKEIPDKSIHAIITDPPYCSGARTSAEVRGRSGMSRREKWRTKPLPNDRMTVTGFTWMMREVAFEAERVLVDGGAFLSFIDWRQYPTLYGAIETTNLRIQMMVVWDKEIMALGNGFRNQHEIILHASKGVPLVYDHSVPNVLRIKRISSSDIHPTEKPVPLIRKLIDVVTEPGNTVLDPFAGSGSVGAACIESGRGFIGMELDPTYYEAARIRLEKVNNRKLSEFLPIDEVPA